MTQRAAFENEDSGNPDVFYHKTFPLARDASSVSVGQQVLQVVQDSFPRVRGLAVSEKGEVFARIPQGDTVFTVQAYPARAATVRGSAPSGYTVTLESKVPKLEEAVGRYKSVELYFLIGGGALVAFILYLIFSAPSPGDEEVRIKVGALAYSVFLGGAGGAFLGRLVGRFYLGQTLKGLTSSDAFRRKEQLERKLTSGLDALVSSSPRS